MNDNTAIWRQYYEKALSRKHSASTELAGTLNESGLKVTVDCGCGTGSDAEYLAQQGYQVWAFDLNPDSIAICRERFAQNALVQVSEATFEDFSYPSAGVVIANSSLFFADPKRFERTWLEIVSSLECGGVFAGDFMGQNDGWASGYRSATTALTRQQVLDLFADFDIVRFHERDEMGQTALGRTKHWHIFSVVAIKRG